MCDSIRYYTSETRVGGSLEFQLDDGTGIIKVRCYDDVTAELARTRCIPGYGDRVKIQGTYQFKARTDFVILGSAKGIEITRNLAHHTTTLAKIAGSHSSFKEGDPVIVDGPSCLGKLAKIRSRIDVKR